MHSLHLYYMIIFILYHTLNKKSSVYIEYYLAITNLDDKGALEVAT